MPAQSFEYKSYVTSNESRHDQDIHYKMSKKIAQLTKVVCMLNTRSEDYVDLFKQNSKIHEDEICDLKNSYSSKIRDLEKKLEKERDSSCTVLLLGKCIDEKQQKIIEMESEYDKLINEYQLKEEMMKMKHNTEIINLQQTLVEYKEKYDKELSEVKQFAEQWKSHQCPNIERISSEKLQLEAKLKNLEEKYSLLELDKESKIKDLIESYECKIQETIKFIKDEKTKKENELLTINKNLLNDLKTQQHIYEQSVIRNNEEKDELVNSVKSTTEKNLTDYWQNMLNQERDEFQTELSKLHKSNEEIKYNLENQIQSLKSQYDQLKSEFTNYQTKSKSDCEKLRRKIGDLQIIEENLKRELNTKDEKLINLEKAGNAKYFQLRKECDELLEKIKTTEDQIELKNEIQMNKQKVILASKYEDMRSKLKETQKLLKTSQNEVQSLKNQLSLQQSNLINLKEIFTSKLKNARQLSVGYLSYIEEMKRELLHINKLIRQEMKTKYECYYQCLLAQKTADLRKTLYTEIEQKVNKDKEISIKSVTSVKQNEIDHLQQVNNELKLKLTRQYKEYENEVTKTKRQAEEALNKEKSKSEEFQMAYKENEQKLIKEVALRESLENQLVKSSAEIEQLKNNYEVLSKQAKLEKSSRFTDLVAELDRKWSETVGRECARVRGETCMKLELDYKVKLEEIRRRYDQSLSDNNNQWEIKFQKKQLELDELIQNKNDNNQEISSANTNESLEGLTTKSDECIQTDDMRNDSEKEANQSNNIEMIDSFTQSDLRWDDENKHADTNLIMTKRNENKEQDTQYEDVIRQKQLQLNEIQTNYNKLFEIYTQSQLNFEKIQDDLKARLYTALVENKEKTTLIEEMKKNLTHEIQTTKEYYENVTAKQRTEFTLAQNILKSKIHELHQQLLVCSCESLKMKCSKLSSKNQLLPDISVIRKQNLTSDDVSSSLMATEAFCQSKILTSTSTNHDHSCITQQREQTRLYMDNKSQGEFRLPALST